MLISLSHCWLRLLDSIRGLTGSLQPTAVNLACCDGTARDEQMSGETKRNATTLGGQCYTTCRVRQMAAADCWNNIDYAGHLNKRGHRPRNVH